MNGVRAPDDPARSGTLEWSLGWMGAGHAHFAATLDGLRGSLDASSLLPGWTRAHLASHVARNADALGNLLRWAATGIETPMYESPEQRDRDIEAGSRRPEGAIIDDVVAANGRLEALAASMDRDAWSVPLRTRRGREIAASEVPYMRNREVWLHAADLGGPTGFRDIPPELVVVFLDDVAREFADRADCPALLLIAPDFDRRWRIGPLAATPERVERPAGELLELVSGRAAGSGALPAWL